MKTLVGSNGKKVHTLEPFDWPLILIAVIISGIFIFYFTFMALNYNW
jgi:hypothetical protein